MQTQHVGPASGTRGWTEAADSDCDEYIRSLSASVLQRLAGARVRPVQAALAVLQRDLTRGVVDAYHWHDLLRAVDDPSVRSAIQAVIIAINRAVALA